jgi:NADH dehydrogenase (ubiquinone) 1 alpha subcomplex subunit 8
MPPHVPPVPEIGATSAALKSASFFIAARCQPYNDDFMKCRRDNWGNRGPGGCLLEGRRVTRCAISVYHPLIGGVVDGGRIQHLNKACGDAYKAHYECLDAHNQQFKDCRPAERGLNACVMQKLVYLNEADGHTDPGLGTCQVRSGSTRGTDSRMVGTRSHLCTKGPSSGCTRQGNGTQVHWTKSLAGRQICNRGIKEEAIDREGRQGSKIIENLYYYTQMLPNPPKQPESILLVELIVLGHNLTNLISDPVEAILDRNLPRILQTRPLPQQPHQFDGLAALLVLARHLQQRQYRPINLRLPLRQRRSTFHRRGLGKRILQQRM